MINFAVQELRGIACLIVVLIHAVGFLVSKGYYFDNNILYIVRLIGDLGVDLFFIISGYVMVLVSKEKKLFAPFLIDRVIRVVPLYWFYTSILLISFMIISPDKVVVFDVIKSYLFIPNKIDDLSYLPLLGPGWTLSFEMMFYIIVGFSIYFSSEQRLRVFFVFFVIVFCVSFSYFFIASNFIFNSIMFEFLFGVASYYIFSKASDFSNINKLVRFFLGGGCLY
ncbi:acyltransferase family protein [Marinomonas polaris]|uniref:acyltransferase family protein n=1 Tax=Marinomonas polaris TaxID=293552 RepID=UPI003F96165E